MGQAEITDSSNSFRAIRVETLSRLTLAQDQFHTSELLIDSLKKGPVKSRKLALQFTDGNQE